MGESAACLLRSFSAPSDASREHREGDPLRALGDSISFGRFMSESLAWEKWSTFSHNHYLEEAEKISKPGSVAQKKAYFEAHNKRIAAKKAAALLEEASAGANVYESETTAGIHNNSSMDSESPKVNTHVTIGEEQQEKDNPVTEVPFSDDAIVCSPNVERHEVEIAKAEASSEPVVEQIVNVEYLGEVKNLNQLENVKEGDEIVATQDEKMPNKDTAVQDSISKKRPVKFSTKSPKIPQSSAKQITSMQPIPGNDATPISKKSVRGSIDRKRSTPKSLHKSINFGSHAGEISEKSSPLFQNIGIARVHTNSPKISKDSSNSRQTLIRASIGGALKKLSINPESENRRAETLLDKPVAGGLTANGKWQSLSLEPSKASSASESKARSPTISFPFSFRSEERAAKRREFFQKLEEKSITKEAEKVQPRTKSKDKTEYTVKSLLHSTGFKAKSNEDVYRASQLPSSLMKKMPLTQQPQSPNLRKKLPPRPIQDASSLPHRKPSVTTDSSKRLIWKKNQTTNRSVTSPPNKTIHENVSPNIQ